MGLTARWKKRKELDEAKAMTRKMIAEAYDDIFFADEVVWMYGFRKASEANGDPFGKERMERAYWTIIGEFKQMLERFQYGKDDSHIYAMDQYLKRIGVDIKALQEEAERRYPGGVKRETKRWGEE